MSCRSCLITPKGESNIEIVKEVVRGIAVSEYSSEMIISSRLIMKIFKFFEELGNPVRDERDPSEFKEATQLVKLFSLVLVNLSATGSIMSRAIILNSDGLGAFLHVFAVIQKFRDCKALAAIISCLHNCLLHCGNEENSPFLDFISSKFCMWFTCIIFQIRLFPVSYYFASKLPSLIL